MIHPLPASSPPRALHLARPVTGFLRPIFDKSRRSCEGLRNICLLNGSPEQRGAADIEYCLIAALAGLAVFGAVKLVGPYLKSVFASATPSTANPAVEIILYRKGD